MWTEAHRARHDARLKEIVSLHAVAEVARWLERADPPRSGRATPYGADVRAIAWHLRIGGPWRRCRQADRTGAPCTAGFANGWSKGCSTTVRRCWAGACGHAPAHQARTRHPGPRSAQSAHSRSGGSARSGDFASRSSRHLSQATVTRLTHKPRDGLFHRLEQAAPSVVL